ncbi:hypothetical protein MKW98_011263 [Papaver atlanticum]|uniref:Zinc knuckle CX2CX4HX4C domain-containing protein n=1 Tax=Papaver atlanticum TaxID=357466 RepID=A0AAD4STU9_9MAGN|nr:hypothetical protein MKW98_011263 [Papaver atlanticum]
MIQICNFNTLPDNFSMSYEVFEITLHNLYLEQTRIVNVIENTFRLGELVAYGDPIPTHNGYNSMRIKLRLNLSNPLKFGIHAPNNLNGINWIDFVYQELPRLFCSFCHRLGHLKGDCIDLFLLNNKEIHITAPPQHVQQIPDLLIEPLSEDSHDDDYYQEMYHNVDIEVPDSDWSLWDSDHNPSLTSSGQDKSVISFSEGEGYKIPGFHSDSTSSESERTVSADCIMEENIDLDELQGSEQHAMPISLSPSQTSIHDQQFSPSNFLVSDIEESDLFSDNNILNHSASLSSPAIKRQNLDQQAYL